MGSINERKRNFMRTKHIVLEMDCVLCAFPSLASFHLLFSLTLYARIVRTANGILIVPEIVCCWLLINSKIFIIYCTRHCITEKSQSKSDTCAYAHVLAMPNIRYAHAHKEQVRFISLCRKKYKETRDFCSFARDAKKRLKKSVFSFSRDTASNRYYCVSLLLFCTLQTAVL